jgi:acetyltransferase-like isoleucine patch superfamily enzyme
MNINFFIIFVLICFIFLSDTLFCIFSMSTVKILYLREELKYKRKDNKTEINPNSHIVIPINNGFLFYFKHLISTFPRYFDYRLSRVPSHHFRYFVYRHVYHVSMAEKVVIYHGTEIRSPFLIKIGKGTVIGDNAILDGRNGIVIGENVNFSSNVSIWTEQHDHRDAYFRCETQRKKPVVIHNRAWIGPNTILRCSSSRLCSY